MATAAELRARLAKHKQVNLEQGVSDAVPKDLQPGNSQESVSVAKLPAAGRAGESSAVADGGVVTGLQPTTLVVVERPVTAPQQDTAARDELQQPSTNLDTSNPVHVNFLQRLADLESAFLARDPLMRTHLKAIHTTMIDYEEIANLLTVDEISKIMAAQQSHTNVVLTQLVVKSSKAKAAAKTAQLGLNDI